MEKAPSDLQKVLVANPKAKAKWDDLTSIGRRDYISWIVSAKQEKTRAARIGRTPSMLMSGKRRPCCFALVPMNLYKALGTNDKAKATWKELTPDQKRDFIDWIDSAKGTEMRGVRIIKTTALLQAGKHRF